MATPPSSCDDDTTTGTPFDRTSIARADVPAKSFGIGTRLKAPAPTENPGSTFLPFAWTVTEATSSYGLKIVTSLPDEPVGTTHREDDSGLATFPKTGVFDLGSLPTVRKTTISGPEITLATTA